MHEVEHGRRLALRHRAVVAGRGGVVACVDGVAPLACGCGSFRGVALGVAPGVAALGPAGRTSVASTKSWTLLVTASIFCRIASSEASAPSPSMR